MKTKNMNIYKIAKKAGEILRKNSFMKTTIEMKKENDPVTKLDKYIEIYIKNEVSKIRKKVNFIGEEYGFEDNNSNETWIIDPIDGTKSFIKKQFNSSISIAVEKENILEEAVVYDFMKDIMYINNRDKNLIYYNNKKVNIQDNLLNLQYIQVSGLAEKLIGNDFDEFRFKQQSGSIALSMAQSAFQIENGLIMYEPNKGSIYDVAGGYKLLKNNKSLKITDIFGNKFDYKNPTNGIIALNKDKYTTIFKKLKITR